MNRQSFLSEDNRDLGRREQRKGRIVLRVDFAAFWGVLRLDEEG